MEGMFGNYVGQVETNLSSTYFYNQEGPSGRIEVCRIYHDFEYVWKDHQPKLEIGYYSTSQTSDDELSRLISLGEIAELVLLKGDYIVKRLRGIIEDHKEAVKAANLEYSRADKAVQEEKLRIQSEKEAEIEAKFKKGVRNRLVE